MPTPAKNILQNYLRRLTNLSGNNRSLLLLRLPAEQLLDVHEMGFLNGEPSFEIIKALIAGENKKICSVLDSRMEANNNVSHKLKKLQRIDRFIFEERGSNDLHVGWPFIRGKFSDGTAVRCPLLFFPVEIVQQGSHWVLQIRSEAGVTFNKAFLLAYAYYNKIKLDEELLDYNYDDFDKDAMVFITQLYELLKNKIELNFNADTFLGKLEPFTVFKKTEYDGQQRNGELKLFSEAVLGVFPQAGSQLVPDYLQMLGNDSIGAIEDIFVDAGAEAPLPGMVNDSIATSLVKEEKLFTPFVIDAYQEEAIKVIKNGSSIVVQGPPGTGKSQLICNILADAIASGKRALLVCQKRAALDVVYKRMKEIDLQDFLGLIHDFRNDRKDIFSKIARQIDQVEEYRNRNRSVDVIQTERQFNQVCRRIDQITEELEEFRKALYNDEECGLSPKQLYLTSALHAPSINIRQEYHHFPFTATEVFLGRIKRYANYASRYSGKDYLWEARKSFASYQPSAEMEIENTITDITAYQRQVSAEIFRLTGAKLNLEHCESFLFREEEVLGMLSVLKNDRTYKYFQTMIAEPDDETSLLWLSNMERVVMNCFDDVGPEVTVRSELLGRYQEALYERMRAKGNFIRLLHWEFFSKNKFMIKRLLVANELAYNKFGMQVLEQRIDCRLNLEHHLTALRAKPWLTELPDDYRKESFQRWFQRQKFAIRAKLIFNSLREVKDAINVDGLTRTEFASLFRDLLHAVKDIRAKKITWEKYLSTFQIRQLILDPELEKEMIVSLRRDFDSLCEFDKLKEDLQTHEREVIHKLYDAVQRWDGNAMVSLFENSIRLVWLEHLETKYPVLRAVSSLRMEELQGELQQLLEKKQELSQEILLVKAREKAYETIAYNRLNNRVTYRDLYHQVTKKKKIWPVRKVIGEFYDELFQLVPCWMASPDAVSAIFPMQQLFDLVIFDEASQCFAERGIPAMFRGKQVVIAGDDQQLRPNELYQVRWDEENETPELEVESLLELGSRYLSTVHLQGHYRSQSIELIDFSNRYFYESRLRLLPDRHTMNRDEAAIEYYKVDGVWENHTNQVEGEAVVRHVLRLLQDFPEKEIGIVTFNAPQQMLILDLLEAEMAKQGQIIPATLFVKNIENVQGDEKDIIIFSIGYAPDKKGKMSMQFGSLNASGGENRLNVAVTRAREKIIIVTSIFPEQLKTGEGKNLGPGLLRKYLEFAREVSERKYRPNDAYYTVQNGHLSLNHQLQRWGKERLNNFSFEVNSLPYADINVRQDDQYLGIILTDDERYYKALSVKDAHAYTPALLKQKNWNYRMVYSRNYWKDMERVERDLMLFIGNQLL